MIALTPQFASLLVAIAASAVVAAPNSHSEAHGRRYVLDVDLPGLAKVHMRPRSSSAIMRIHRRVQDGEQPADTKAVFIQPPASARSFGAASDTAGAARRDLSGPIDEPDSGEQVHAENADAALVDVLADHDEGVLRKRMLLRVDSQYGPGMIITHATAHGAEQITRSLALQVLDRRGLLDPLMPILGSLPGIGGIINLVGGTLADVLSGLPILGPILGGLLLSPRQSASAQNIGDANDLGAQYFLDASPSQNATTIYVVDSGHPTSLAIASQANSTNTTAEHIISLQMAFVNSTSGMIQAYCATFDNTNSGQSELAAKPCLTDGVTNVPHASQSFGWNPLNKAVRPMWNDDATNKKRDYVVEAGASATASTSSEDGDTKSVVLVFEPFSMPASTNGANSTESSGKDATGAAVADVDDEHTDAGVPVYIAGAYAS
ncbi:hypothetical protein RhiJN_08934 [Ceratobasidium sp. AG-Ba]|nr:hypothetical protein RhiJN_08934 [Ceratobasidium sp. AG-Ba]